MELALFINMMVLARGRRARLPHGVLLGVGGSPQAVAAVAWAAARRSDGVREIANTITTAPLRFEPLRDLTSQRAFASVLHAASAIS